MRKTVLVVVIAAITATASAQAEVNVNVNLGIPAPRVIVPAPPARVVVSAPPEVLFNGAPLFIAPSRLGFYVGVSTPYDIVFSSDFYYLYYGNSWLRSRGHNGPWVEVPYRELPPVIRKYRIEQIRSYRNREYRTYLRDQDHYRGRSFQPGREQRNEMKDERRRDREELKDERRRDKEEWKDERRRDKEERKDGNRDREHGRQGRD